MTIRSIAAPSLRKTAVSLTVRATVWATSLTLGLLMAGAASAAVITDPAGDFLPSYTGPQTGDLDVLSVSATYDGSQFVLSSTLAAPIGTTPGVSYVFGFNRGQGTARFGAIAPGVVFDSVVSITVGGADLVRDLISGASTALTANEVQFNGSTLSAEVPAGLLPVVGLLSPSQYQVNLWPRLGAGNNNQIADFAPDNSDFTVSVAEPGTLALLLTGLAGIAWAGRPLRIAAGQAARRV